MADMQRFTSFDIETNLDASNRKILCAATAYEDSDGTVKTPVFTEESHGEQFVAKFCAHLLDRAAAGNMIVSWNGAGFDFDVLGRVLPSMRDNLVALCIHHFDPCAITLCTLGYPVGLDAAAKYMLNRTKAHTVTLSDGETVINNMGGAMAEKYWNAGETEAVIEYLKGDVALTLDLAKKIDELRAIQWFAKSGKPMAIKAGYPAGDLYSVADALRLPRPDTAWMNSEQRTNLSRERFYGWMFDGELP